MIIIRTSVILFLVVASVSADDWPRFLGPNGNGASSEKLTLSPNGPKRLWTADVGRGCASLVVR